MPWPLIPLVIDEATSEDADEWRTALPYVRFPVPAPAVSRDETNLAAELERLLNKRADRSVPGARVHDALTHFVEKHRDTILSRLRSEP